MWSAWSGVVDVIYILLEAVYCTKYLMQVPNRVLCKTVEKHLTDKAKLVRSLSNDGGLIIYMILAALSTCSSSIHMIIFCAACLISVVTLILPEIEPYLVFLTQILCISISKNVAVDCFLLGESSEDLFFFFGFFACNYSRGAYTSSQRGKNLDDFLYLPEWLAILCMVSWFPHFGI